MKKILYISIGLLTIPLFALAITGENARFDWSNGQPVITDDTTNTCTGQAVVRFDFLNGEPGEVFDTTATCTAAVVATALVTNIPTVQVRGQTVINGQTTIR